MAINARRAHSHRRSGCGGCAVRHPVLGAASTGPPRAGATGTRRRPRGHDPPARSLSHDLGQGRDGLPRSRAVHGLRRPRDARVDHRRRPAPPGAEARRRSSRSPRSAPTRRRTCADAQELARISDALDELAKVDAGPRRDRRSEVLLRLLLRRDRGHARRLGADRAAQLGEGPHLSAPRDRRREADRVRPSCRRSALIAGAPSARTWTRRSRSPREERAPGWRRIRARDAALAADLRTLLAEHEAVHESHFLERAVPLPPHTALTASLAGQTLGAYRLDLADRSGRHGQRVAGRALRRPLRRPRGDQAAEHRADGPRRRRAIPARRQHPRPAHAPAHRAPRRCRRLADRPAVSRARARRRPEHRPLLRRARARRRGASPPVPRRAGGGRPRARQPDRAPRHQAGQRAGQGRRRRSSCSTSASPSCSRATPSRGSRWRPRRAR